METVSVSNGFFDLHFLFGLETGYPTLKREPIFQRTFISITGSNLGQL